MNPTAYADQLHAASRDATMRQHRAGPSTPVDLTTRPWLAAQISAYTLRAATGTLNCCPHLTDAPQVAHTALWAPDRLVCSDCVATLRPATDAEDSTCDRCRTITALIHAHIVALGPVLMSYGLCPTCLNLETPPAKETHQ